MSTKTEYESKDKLTVKSKLWGVDLSYTELNDV